MQAFDFFTPELVIIDTFSRFVEGDENSSKVAQDFYDYSGKELKRRKIAYVRLDHIGRDAARGALGSSAKVDDLGLIWTMSRTKKPNIFLLKNGKARAHIAEPQIQIERRTTPLHHVVLSEIPWSTLMATALRFEEAVEMIEELMAKNPKHTLAQGRVWADLGPSCKTKSISRSELFDASHYLKNKETELDEEV